MDRIPPARDSVLVAVSTVSGMCSILIAKNFFHVELFWFTFTEGRVEDKMTNESGGAHPQGPAGAEIESLDKEFRASAGKLFTTEKLCEIWARICSDSDGREALERLNADGFPISHLIPCDATFKLPCWADYIAALALVPNKQSTRRIHKRTSFRKYWPLVRELQRFAATVNLPFVELTILSRKDSPSPASASLREDLLKTALMLDHFLSWDYCVRYLNSRNALIAELRWTIREKTGRPHDRELSVLIDAAFRAAGYKNGCCIDSTTLDRIEKREKENRVKANRRIRSLIRASAVSL